MIKLIEVEEEACMTAFLLAISKLKPESVHGVKHTIGWGGEDFFDLQ